MLFFYWSVSGKIMKKKFHVEVFGCQMNYADSARIKAVLIHCWFEYVESIEEADVIVFDTCSVRQKSEDKITGKLTQIDPSKKVWITWCMIQHGMRANKMTKEKKPQQYRVGNFLWKRSLENLQILGLSNQEIKDFQSSVSKTDFNETAGKNEYKKSIIPINYAFNPMFGNLAKTFPNVELFFRIDDVGLLPFILPKLGYEIDDTEQLWNEYEKILPENINTSMNKHNKTAYVPISTGCNQFCSYCIVPYARGLERNFEVEHIVNEVKMHLVNGVKEIVLLGQIVNKHPKFVEILKEILKLDWLEWLRYTSPYPTYYSDELLALHEQEEKLCPHIHIPLQSGSDPVLRKMFRWYTAQQSYDFLNKIKGLKRDIAITTDIIVGFTDETEEDFQKTLDVVEYWSFDMIYIGVYSPRPGTYADRKLVDNVSREEKHDRWDRLNTLLNQCSKKNNLAEVGKIRKVLINEFLWVSRDGVYKYAGYTDNMKQITVFSDDEINLGDFVQVEITKGVVFKLMGKKI